VTGTDVAPQPAELGAAEFVRADLTDYGQAVQVCAGADAVVHLANIPAPGLRTPAVTFNENMTMNFNVFRAATQIGVSRVPTTTYALSKVTSETAASHIADWSGIPFIAMRFSNILGPADYRRFPSFWDDPAKRKWNLWGYIDERDAAASCRLALDANLEGAESFIIAAADTVMTTPSTELMARVFPGVPLRGDVEGNDTLLSIDHARRLLGFEPAHSWRQHVDPAAAS